MVRTVMRKAKTKTERVTIVTLILKLLIRLDNRKILNTKWGKKYLRRQMKGICLWL